MSLGLIVCGDGDLLPSGERNGLAILENPVRISGPCIMSFPIKRLHYATASAALLAEH